MRQRLLGTFLWFVLTPVIGLGALLWAGLRTVLARVERVLMLGGLAVALSMPNPLAAQLSQWDITHSVLVVPYWVLAGLGFSLLGAGLVSPWSGTFRRGLRHRGWFL
jgi:hypothetical protein